MAFTIVLYKLAKIQKKIVTFASIWVIHIIGRFFNEDNEGKNDAASPSCDATVG